MAATSPLSLVTALLSCCVELLEGRSGVLVPCPWTSWGPTGQGPGAVGASEGFVTEASSKAGTPCFPGPQESGIGRWSSVSFVNA